MYVYNTWHFHQLNISFIKKKKKKKQYGYFTNWWYPFIAGWFIS